VSPVVAGRSHAQQLEARSHAAVPVTARRWQLAAELKVSLGERADADLARDQLRRWLEHDRTRNLERIEELCT